MTKELLTAGELADRLAVRPGTIRAWVRAGKIPEVYVSPKVRRFDWASVVEMIERGQRLREGNHA